MAVRISLEPGKEAGIDVAAWLDFVIGPDNMIHALVITGEKDERRVDIVKMDASGRLVSSLIKIDQLVSARRIDMDGEGNYYLLGRPMKKANQLAQQEYSGEQLPIVHKYSSQGRFLQSYLPINKPLSQQEGDMLFSALEQRCNFVVLPNGEIYFLRWYLDSPQKGWWEVPRVLYHVDNSGRARIVNPVEPGAPGEFLLQGILKSEGQLICEWAKADYPGIKKLTLPDGSTIGSAVDVGGILSIRGNDILSTGRRGNGCELSLSSIAR